MEEIKSFPLALVKGPMNLSRLQQGLKTRVTKEGKLNVVDGPTLQGAHRAVLVLSSQSRAPTSVILYFSSIT